ncbi:N-acetylmuramoyl-L-alanine amidase [Paenibacillus filicis]|uniref:N-acetylmuramoyl-L-alanine amidase n=1 Tax=Paenibacillus gyeongsangnamensis TaxID=3388067 RepID=A0ABT4Q9I4_9BACL|nr:N-acetylmuramoyl-L-alanine amidase [Paenibacillus filicis]MCZ8513537.1 N-acetylmuramoyl-L-alanine amidase [Paenibacillus filicis]
MCHKRQSSLLSNKRSDRLKVMEADGKGRIRIIYWTGAVMLLLLLIMLCWSLFSSRSWPQEQAFYSSSGLPALQLPEQRTDLPDEAQLHPGMSEQEERQAAPSGNGAENDTDTDAPSNKPVQLPPVFPGQTDMKRDGEGGIEVPLVMIDPGHQRKGNNEPEPVGPDTNETKPKVSSGTMGVRTKKPEYVLNLEVSERLKDELTARGIRVAMTRETHEVNLSNKQRAELGNDARASLVVRIHADGDASPKTRGLSVLYPSRAVPATKAVAEKSFQAAAFVLEQLQLATGSSNRGLAARTDLSGFNWSKVPVILVELGFMTNPEEDVQLSEPDYQLKLAKGIAEGIDRFLKTGGE